MRLVAECEPLSGEWERLIAGTIQKGKDVDDELRLLLWKSALKYCYVVATDVHRVNTGSSATLEDVFTAGAEELWNQTLLFKPKGVRFTAFSRRAVKTACVDAVKLNWQGMKMTRGHTAQTVEVKEWMGDAVDGYRAVEQESQFAAVLAEVGRLSPSCRDVVKLHYGLGCVAMDVSQIGKRLGITRQAVHARLRKGWKALSLRSRLLR